MDITELFPSIKLSRPAFLVRKAGELQKKITIKQVTMCLMYTDDGFVLCCPWIQRKKKKTVSENTNHSPGLQVLTMVVFNSSVFWNITQCNS
jgi:cAMP phosphodiesterase